jgi:hypothetical protein
VPVHEHPHDLALPRGDGQKHGHGRASTIPISIWGAAREGAATSANVAVSVELLTNVQFAVPVPETPEQLPVPDHETNMYPVFGAAVQAMAVPEG